MKRREQSGTKVSGENQWMRGQRESTLLVLYLGARDFNSGCLWCVPVGSAAFKCMIKSTDVFIKLHLGFKP